jgi:hypothetical protein
VNNVFTNYRLAHYLCRNARSLVETRYGWDWIAQRLLDVYKEMVGNTASGLHARLGCVCKVSGGARTASILWSHPWLQ